MEYIEREAILKKAIKERRFVFMTEDLLNYEVIFKTVYKDLAEFINSIPAADVAPVRHANWEECHWVEQDGPYSLVAHPKAAFRCSGCKYVFKKELLWKDNYCPNCGCKMHLEG